MTSEKIKIFNIENEEIAETSLPAAL